MLIDFHTHAFPDSLAEKAVNVLVGGVERSGLGFDSTCFADGKASGLKRLMDEGKVTHSVLLPVATRSGQAEGINIWADELAGEDKRIIPFGAFYPDNDWERNLECIAESGRKGIKLHGDFQNFYADEERMIDIYRRCGELGLIVVMHAGLDCVSPDDIHVTPERMANVLDRVSGVRFVLAHMGGVCCEDKAAVILRGADIFVDTSYSAGRLSAEKMSELIRAYGSERVLFASDSPWNRPIDVYRLLEDCCLEEHERRNIYYGHAAALLGL